MALENTLLPERREMLSARTRSLGETGIEVPWVGLGTRPLGYTADNLIDSVMNSVTQGVVPDRDAVHLMKNALDMECNLFNTAPTYGNGRAERLLGEAIKERRSRAIVVTRAGRMPQQDADFSAKALEESLNASLRRLQSNYIDVLLLHCPPDAVLDASHEAWGFLQKMKTEGKIRAFGASVSGSVQLIAAAEKTPAQVLQTHFSIYNQEAASAFDALKAKGMGLLLSGVLDSGFLGGRYGRLSVFFDPRKRWSRTDVWRRGQLREKIEALRPASIGLGQMAIQFALAHPAVSCAIAGVRDQYQLINNVDSAAGVIEEVTLQGLRRLWLDEIAGAGLSK